MDSERQDTGLPEWSVTALPQGVGRALYELWQRRSLLLLLGLRAAQTAYQKAVLGIAWLFVRPLVIAVAATLVFREVLRVDSGDVPYPLFVLCSYSIWILFQRAIVWGTRGLSRNRAMLHRVSVPALVPVAASVSPAIVESATVFACFMLAILYWWIVYGDLHLVVGFHSLLVIPIILATLLSVWVVCLVTSVLFIRARDSWYVLRYALNALTIASPVLYPVDSLPAQAQAVMLANPITSLLTIFRWTLLGGTQPYWPAVLAHIVLLGFALLASLRYFIRHNEQVLEQT